MALCKNCKKELHNDEAAIYKRLVNRGAKEYLCINCLADHMEVEVSDIKEKILHFKRIGCNLFG